MVLASKEVIEHNSAGVLQGAAAPMFPFPEPPPRQDAYGAVVDLVAMCGQRHHDEEMDSDFEAPEDTTLQAGLDMLLSDMRTTKVVKECAFALNFLPFEREYVCFGVDLAAYSLSPQIDCLGMVVSTPLSSTRALKI
jgi:hypothetical protein